MKLVLASGSAVRATLLRKAGVDFSVLPPEVDEDVLKQSGQSAGKSVEAVAADLAAAKAAWAAARMPEAIVIAADQMLECDGVWHDKPATLAAARARLHALAGRTHRLVTALDIRQADRTLCQQTAIASLTMRAFDEAFVDYYLERAGAEVCQSVGAYQLEGLGAQLFAAVEGDFFTILGLPLLSVLETLRRAGAIQA